MSEKGPDENLYFLFNSSSKNSLDKKPSWFSETLHFSINFFEIELKYYNGKPVISEIKRVSKPGRRVYSSIKNLQKTYNGLGVSILSTPRGVMSDNEAREANVGGEVLCTIY